MSNVKIDISSVNVDISKNQLQSDIQTYNTIRMDGLIQLIQRQTDYSKEKAIEKLKEWDGNYLNVIKEWINPNFKIKIEKTKKKSRNQMIFGEIRDFMDTANKQYLQRKKRSEYIENKKLAYLNKLKNNNKIE